VKLAVLAVAATVAVSPAASGTRFLESRELATGGFAEAGGGAYPQLTAWAVLGLRAVGRRPSDPTARYLAAHEGDLTSATDMALVSMAERDPSALLGRLRAMQRPNGSIGGLVNGTAWGVLALRAGGRSVAPRTIRWLLSRQSRRGGWGWSGAPDSNDTAAVIQALRSAGIRGTPIRRALAFLLRYRNADGGFELTPGRGSDAQSTAWAVQAFAAAGRQPPRGALAYLRRLQRSDGSFRYSGRYVTTPVWVTAQVLPALAGKAFPLRR
jgi:energy-coupling factor transport system substrate-specific component